MAGLVLLTRPGCGLCDDFVEAMVAGTPTAFAATSIVDVDSRADWVARFGLLVPVLLDEAGDVVCESFFDADRVAAAMRPVAS